MAKAIIELDSTALFKDGDMLVYFNGKFVPITNKQLFKRIDGQLFYLEEMIKSVERQVDALNKEIKRDRGEIE